MFKGKDSPRGEVNTLQTRREAIQCITGWSLAAASLELVSLLSGCGRGPSKTDKQIESDTWTVKQKAKLDSVVGMIAEAFAEFDPATAARITSNPVFPERTEKIGREDAGVGGWDPLSGKIGFSREILETYPVLSLVVLLGHEFIHAGKDKLPISSLSTYDQDRVEMSTYGIQKDKLIPAVETVLKRRNEWNEENERIIKLETARAQHTVLAFQVGLEVMGSFESDFVTLDQLTQTTNLSRKQIEILTKINALNNEIAEDEGNFGKEAKYLSFLSAIAEALNDPLLANAMPTSQRELNSWNSLVSTLKAAADEYLKLKTQLK